MDLKPALTCDAAPRTGCSTARSPAGATLDLDQLRAAGWILTTYETLRDHEQSFGKLQLACVVFDELQKAKNPASLIHKAVNALNADFALGLTGTPVENRIEDLHRRLDGRRSELQRQRECSYQRPARATLKLLMSTTTHDNFSRGDLYPAGTNSSVCFVGPGKNGVGVPSHQARCASS